MEETQIGVAQYVSATTAALASAALAAPIGSPKRDLIADAKAETMKFLDQEYMFSSSERGDPYVKKEKVCMIFFMLSRLRNFYDYANVFFFFGCRLTTLCQPWLVQWQQLLQQQYLVF